MKTCKRCGETRSLADFTTAPRNKDGRHSYCRPCQAKAVAASRAKNPDKYRQHAHKSHIARTYGLTPAAFEAMREAQGNACAICREPFTTTPFVDHCHATGAVRALACRECNTMLGMSREKPRILRAAAVYLEHHQSSQRRNAD